MRAQPHNSLGAGARLSFGFPSELPLTLLSGLADQVSIRSRECPNQTLRVGVLTMRQHKCTPELVLPSADVRRARPAASGLVLVGHSEAIRSGHKIVVTAAGADRDKTDYVSYR